MTDKNIEFVWKYTDKQHCESFAEQGPFKLRSLYNTVGWNWEVYELHTEHDGSEYNLVAKGDCHEEHVAQHLAEAVANLKIKDVRCSHKFVDSTCYAHCGWTPPRRYDG